MRISAKGVSVVSLSPACDTVTGVDAAGRRIHSPGVAMAVSSSCHKSCHKHYWKTSHASSKELLDHSPAVGLAWI
jgi:hypothetical protein